MDPDAHPATDDPGALTVRRAPVVTAAGCCRWALCLVLGLSAVAKLLTPHRDDYLLPAPLYYLVSAFELGIAAALLTRYRRPALAAAIALATGGIVVAVAVPDRICGCLGSLLPLDGGSHALLSGIVGALACVGWSGRPAGAARRGPRSP